MFALSKVINEHFRVVYIVKPLVLRIGVRLGDSKNFALDHDLLAVDFH